MHSLSLLTDVGRSMLPFWVVAVVLSRLAGAVPPPQVAGVSLSIVSGQAAIRVDWTMASVEGTFSRYEVQYKIISQSWDASTTETVVDQNVLTVDLTTLQRGTTYNVRVRAVSNGGNGPYSTEDTATVPNMPSQVNPPTVTKAVSSGRPALTVSWSAPQSDSSITKYEVQYRKTPSGDWMSTDVTSPPTTLPNLDPGAEYAFQVRAVSDVGEGPFSMEQRQTTFNVPSQVSGVRLSYVSGQRTITVNWNKPNSERTINKYEVQYALLSSSSYSSSVPAVQGADSLTTTIPGLTRGSTYMVRVRAVSDAGDGPYSPTTSDSMLAVLNVPAAVSDVNVTVVKVQDSLIITVTWIPPQSDVPITHYEVDYSGSGSAQTPLSTTALTATVNGIPGVTYTVRVRAVSAEGAGGWSQSKTTAPPSVPTGVTATSADTSSVTITWNNDGFNYRISEQREGSSERPSQDLVSPPHTITGLDSNTGYTITVEAYSSLGQAGKNINVYTLPEAPSSQNIEVVSSTVIRVTWTAPPNADRLPLTYLIRYQSAEFGSGMKEASTQPVELTGLHPFAEYTVSVQARNTGGPWQLSGNVTGKRTTHSAAPSSPPQSVVIIDALKTHDSLTCTWQLPVKANRNGIITSYFIIATRGSVGEQLQPLGNFTKIFDSPSFDAPTHLRYTVTNLVAQTLYSFRIAAVTSGGTGVFSDLVTRRTNHDLYVSMLTIRVDSDTFSTISWAAPEGVVVSSYKVYYSTYLIGTFMSKTTTTTSQQLNNLPPETPIEVSVIPETAQGPGGSVSRIFFTREGFPIAPVKDVAVMRINSVSLRVAWTPLSLHEARGWPLYTVIVESTAGRTIRLVTNTRNTNDSTVDVDSLDPTTWYSVRVQVGTSAGTNGESLISYPVVVPPFPTDPPAGDVNTAVIAAVLVVIILVIIAIAITVVVLAVVCSCRNKENGSDPNTVEMTQCPAYESVDKAYEDVSHVQPHQQHYEPGNEDYNAIINYRSKESGSDPNAFEMTQSPAYESVGKLKPGC